MPYHPAQIKRHSGAPPCPSGEDDFSAFEHDPGAYVLPAGPWKRMRLDQLDDQVLAFIAAKNWHAEVREFAERVIRQRAGDDEPDEGDAPGPDSAAVKLPNIIFEWQQEMELVHGDHPVVAYGLVLLRRLCEQVTGCAFPPDAEGEHAER